jgi:hypothetical protein
VGYRKPTRPIRLLIPPDQSRQFRGLAMLVLSSVDAERDAALFAESGIGDFEVFPFERSGVSRMAPRLESRFHWPSRATAMPECSRKRGQEHQCCGPYHIAARKTPRVLRCIHWRGEPSSSIGRCILQMERRSHRTSSGVRFVVPASAINLFPCASIRRSRRGQHISGGEDRFRGCRPYDSPIKIPAASK